ncbi:glycoside hydrolase family 18 protein [Chaetomium fimeti]|uniref:Glycoside hydrolase family 18 protein n=1 Tax=Chaetomium fimeti TaxID=1854472 RepID=A0AAE0HB07_9PEZI|nr:glycoside hydrolase family 18 protein [Chaetomium fimeti]
MHVVHQIRCSSSPQEELPRLILYHQTTHDAAGRPISLLPLIHTRRIALTHLIIGALHVHANGTTIHLNDHPPLHPRYRTLRAEARLLQEAGVVVLGMVGGAARGSFARGTLDGGGGGDGGDNNNGGGGGGGAAFERAYGLLRGAVGAYGLDGVDLDVEEPMTLGGAVGLVRRLRADFGRAFVVTFAPVATALLASAVGQGGINLSGFGYGELERVVGREVGFYNAQFYNGFGGAGGTALFDGIVAGGWAPERIVVGQLTSPVNGFGFVRHEELGRTVAALRERYSEIGGVAGWEYFNAVPGGVGRPWEWAESMTRILRPGREPVLRITREKAEMLNEAWMTSAAAGVEVEDGVGAAERWVGLVPNVDYLGMVNE